MKERNLELELRRAQDEVREAKLEKEAYQQKLRKDFKLTKQLLEELQETDNPDPDAMKAIAKKVLRILERNEI